MTTGSAYIMGMHCLFKVRATPTAGLRTASKNEERLSCAVREGHLFPIRVLRCTMRGLQEEYWATKKVSAHAPKEDP